MCVLQYYKLKQTFRSINFDASFEFFEVVINICIVTYMDVQISPEWRKTHVRTGFMLKPIFSYDSACSCPAHVIELKSMNISIYQKMGYHGEGCLTACSWPESWVSWIPRTLRSLHPWPGMCQCHGLGKRTGVLRRTWAAGGPSRSQSLLDSRPGRLRQGSDRALTACQSVAPAVRLDSESERTRIPGSAAAPGGSRRRGGHSLAEARPVGPTP